MNFGCHSSRARWSRLSLERATLFGILAERSTLDMRLRPPPVELRAERLAVQGERAALADGVGPHEDPVLPGGQAPEDLRLHRLGAGEAQVRLHPRESVGGQARALLDCHPDLVVPV